MDITVQHFNDCLNRLITIHQITRAIPERNGAKQ